MIWILLVLACDQAQPLPPSAQEPPPPPSQMVKAAEVEGFLVDGVNSDQGVLLLVEALDDRAKSRAKLLSPSTVLAIKPTVSTDAAEQYLTGIAAVSTVTILCDRADCPEVNSEAGPATSPARKLFPGRDRSRGQ